MNYYSILEAYGISKNDIKRYHFLSEENESLLFVELIPNQCFCPYCSQSFTKIKEYKTKTTGNVTANKQVAFDNETIKEETKPEHQEENRICINSAEAACGY